MGFGIGAVAAGIILFAIIQSTQPKPEPVTPTPEFQSFIYGTLKEVKQGEITIDQQFGGQVKVFWANGTAFRPCSGEPGSDGLGCGLVAPEQVMNGTVAVIGKPVCIIAHYKQGTLNASTVLMNARCTFAP